MLNHMFAAANRNQANIGYAHLGYVTSVNPQNSTIKAQIQPWGYETGFIPYSTPWIGWYAPPNPGDMVLILFQEGSKDVPVGAVLYYSNSSLPPSGVASGEAILHHSDGSYIKFSNDKDITIHSERDVVVTTARNLTATVTGNANVTASGQITLQAPTINLKGNVVVDGTLTANDGEISMTGGNFTTSGDVIAQGISLHSHRHPDVQSGSSDTGEPI